MVARDQLADMNPQYWYFWLGLLLIAVIIFLPNGILGGMSQLMSRRASIMTDAIGRFARDQEPEEVIRLARRGQQHRRSRCRAARATR